MITAILTIILISPAGVEKAYTPKQFDSIVSCERAAKANTKAVAAQTGWKVKSAECKIVG